MLGSKTNKYTLISLLALIVFSIYGVVQLQIQENLNDSIPGSEKLENLLPFLEEGKKTIVFSIKSDDPFDIGKLDSTATNLKVELLESFKSELDTIQFKSDIDPTAFIEFIQDKPYLYLEAADYVSIEKSIDSASMFNSMEANKADLRNPQKFGSAQSILADPLHFSSLAFKNIDQQLGLGDLMNTQGFFLSEENTKLTLHSSLLIDPSDIEASKKLANNLETFTQQWNENHSGLKLDFFGTFLIAQENAKQIKKDIILTLNIALLFIMGLLFFYYRKLSTIFFFVLPGLFGIGLALAMVWLINGQISALALSASAVILGIVVDYSFHYFSHLSVESDPFKTRNQIATPLAISSITTVLAFFSLLFAQSSALQDFGLFTGLSLLFTLVFILLFLPTLLALLQKKPNKNQSSKLNNLIQRLDKNQSKSPKLITLFSLGLTLVLFYFSFSIQFEDDLNQLNYYPEYLQQKELAHQNINPKIEKRITLVSSGSQIEEAVNNDSKLWDLIDSLGSSSDYNSIAPLLISEKEAQQKVELWNTFWNTKDAEVISNFNTAAVANGFRPEVFTSFKDKIGTRQKPLSNYNFILQFASLKKLILQDENTNVISSLKVNKSELESTKKAISSLSDVYIIDGSSIAQSMVDAVKNDFNFLLLVASSMVFITMLLFYGRIELTIISFLPMVLSWIWILGIAAVFGIKFNFINIMIATIIFGLGDDFAIFITDGLQHKLKYKTPVLSTYKAGILLSSISTIVGTGVLIFALHPAIKSIAPISVIGILTIVALSFIIQPLLFNKLILNRTEKGLPPYSFVELFMSVYAFSLFFVGSLLTTCINALIILIPFWKKDSKKLIVHHMIRATTWILINSMVFLKKRYYDYKNLDFSNPSVLLANHTSFLDILIIAQLHPKIIMMVGPWVYNSPIFGWFIRYADYIPAFTSVEENLPTIEDAVSRGYSILIFPEGHRSVDGKLRRFHKGAFFISEKLKLDITPILLHGLQYSLPKSEYNVKSSPLNLKVLSRIKHNDTSYGETYKERTKNISKLFKKELELFQNEANDPDQLFHPLLNSYIYKGPKLEWYFRIKYRFESENFVLIDQLIGNDRSRIYDLGCGYGFLSYYLLLRNNSRLIHGFDYDDEKISIAANSHLKQENIHFASKDIAEIEMHDADAIVISDVLHYLTPEKQLSVLNDCKSALSESGVLIIKDGLRKNNDQHQWTKRSEKWSTEIVKFNKTTNALHFFDYPFIADWAKANDMELRIEKQLEKSSNVIMTLRPY